jgi:hypothetical protein
MAKKLDPVTLARKRMILRLADEIRKLYEKKSGWGMNRPVEEEIVDVIDAWLPQTYAELDADIAETEKELDEKRSEPKGPSLGKRLQEALGYDDSVSLNGMIEGAIEAVLRDRARKGD